MDDLENLLNLHGEVFPMDNGYWIKFEAYHVEPITSIPHDFWKSVDYYMENN